VARDGINIQVNQLRSFSASTTGAGSDIYLSAASPGSIAIGKLSADDLIDIANSQGALQLTDPTGISASSFSLTAQDTVQIASSKAVTLAADKLLKLSAKNIDADLTKLTFVTQAGGSTWLDFEAYSFADAIKLPLIDSANLTLESPSGVRLRLDAFAEGQQQKPFTSISFVRKQNANDLVALRHPYLNNSQLLLGSDNHYYGYTSSKALQTHFDAATNLYRYTALIVSSTGVSLNPVAIYSSDYQLTADNLASAILPAGVTASQVLTSTIAAVFRFAVAGITVKPAEAIGKPLADAVNQVAIADKAVLTGTTSNNVPSGYDPIEQTDLINQLIKSGYIIAAGSTTSSPLLGADVWLDLNRNFRKDADEPSASTNADGGFTLAISASVVSRFDSNGDGKLNDEHLRLISSGGIDSLTNKSLADLMLIADYSNTTLTPVTTLAALLADAGVSAATSAAIQRAYGVAVVDQADHSTAYNPYVNLATGGSEAISQVLAHTRLSGLFLLASSLGRHGGSSPMESLQRMAASLAKVKPESLGASSAVEQRQALMAVFMPELGSFLSASQRQAIATISETVNDELDALQSYAERYAEAGFSPRSLLPAVSSLKALLTTVFTESLPQVLTGSLSIEQLQQRFAAQLAAGAHDSLPLDNDHLVAVTPFQQGRLQAGGAATFLISVASPAPAQGLRLIYSLEAPEGSTIQDSQSGSGRHQPAAISEFSIPAGRRSTTFTIQLPDRLADPIAQISLRLRYADSGFAINPEAASAEYFIDSLDPSATDEAPRSVAGSSIAADSLTGSEGPDRIDAGWGADSIDGRAGNDQLNGEGGSDSILGGSGADQLDGGSGDDSLRGCSGRDILHGDGGDDHLYGEEGDDKLDGGEGNDLLDGGQGFNVLIGGRGADRFVLKSPGPELDLIVDFDPLKGDQFVVLSSRYPDAESQDFAIIGGHLLFRGTPIALVENNGRNYGVIRDLTPYLLFTDTATTKPQPTTASPTAGSTSTSVSPSSLHLLATPSAGQERTQISNAAVLLANEARGMGLSLRPAIASNGSTPSGIILSGEGTSTILVDFSTLNAQELADSQTTLLLYRVNRTGAFLSTDGSTTVSNLDAAVIGSIGAVNDDAGRSLFSAGASQVELSTGQELRFAISRRNQAPVIGGKLQINETNGGLTFSLSSIGATTPDLILRATIASQVSSATEMAVAQKAGLGDLLYLNNGEILDVSLASSCRNTNTYAFVKLELSTDGQGYTSFHIIDANGKAIPVANTDEFRAAIRSNLAAGFRVAQGGNRTTFHTWTVTDGSGFYAPVMLSQNGDIYFIGSFNADGRQHIKPIGDGAFCFEDLSGSNSDFDYNDGVLHLSRRVAGSENRSVVMAPASQSGTAIYLRGRTNYYASKAPQLIHSNGLGGNVIRTRAANDTVVLYSSKDRVQLEAGSDRVHILSGSSQNSIDLGADADADLVYFYRPKADQGISSLINFDVSKDIISLINLDIISSISFAISGGKATLLVDSKPLLELVGDFSADRLEAAIRRSDLGTSDSLTSIAERGLLVAEIIPGLISTAEQRSDGLWYGYSVDLARTISEQLTGSADRLAIRPADSLLSGFREISGGYADVALLGSSDISLGVDSSEPYLLDMQSFLVNGVSNAAQLADQTIGVITGSSAKANALAFLNSNGINAAILEFTASTELAEALRTHAIAAIASERTRLMDYKARIPGSTLLEETFSSQPLTVVLPENQKRLKDAVSAIVEVPAAAENLGIEPSDLPNLIAQSERGGSDFNAIDPQVREFLDLGSSPDSSSSLGKAVGLAKGFTQRVLARLGNASELWKRHFP
jgi:Ca2+-binding RTX toxin-like protein/ABC-type amino acid transport substrate-binding protein